MIETIEKDFRDLKFFMVHAKAGVPQASTSASKLIVAISKKLKILRKQILRERKIRNYERTP